MIESRNILDFIDKILEGRISHDEALKWAEKNAAETAFIEDPTCLLIYLAIELDPEEGELNEDEMRKELLAARESIIRGIPCPSKEFRKSIEAYWRGWTPKERVVVGQIKNDENGERILEIIEEDWGGKRLFYERISIPLKEKGNPLTDDLIEDMKTSFENGETTKEIVLTWILNNLQSEESKGNRGNLIRFYWSICRVDDLFSPSYGSRGG